jgi:hypothetical protein
MQRIERSHADLACVTASEISAKRESVFRQRDLAPNVGGLVRNKLGMCSVGLLRCHSSAKLMLPESVGPFGTMERCQNYWRRPLDATTRFGGMDVSQVQGDYEARININVQYRPRSSSTTLGRIRSPNISLARASKSGHLAGFSSTFSGTMRAMTLSRSRSSTVLPARSHALRRRVSRSWRKFTEGMVVM